MQTYYDHQVGRFEAPGRLDDREALITRARQARAEATAEVFGALLKALAAATRGAIGSIRYAERGGLHTRTPAGLTGACD